MAEKLTPQHQAGLVESRKDGRWMYYRLPGEEAGVTVREAVDWVKKSLAGLPGITEDLRRLKRILKLDPVELCKRQCQR